MRLVKKITPCVWFDDQAEAAANTYIGVFPNSRITHIERYGEVGHEHHGKPAGSVMTVAFELDGKFLRFVRPKPLRGVLPIGAARARPPNIF